MGQGKVASTRKCCRYRLDVNFSRSRPSLLRASLNTFPLEFLATFPPGIVWVLATFAQPYILQDLLTFINSYQSNGEQGQPLA